MNKVGALVVSFKGNRYDPHEFFELVRSADFQLEFMCVAAVDKPDTRTYIKSGKLAELKDQVNSTCVPLVIINRDISSSQHRNIQRKICCQIIDRTGLILNIFAQRARSFEGRVQVELAQLDYLKSKLTREWTHLERQRGGLGLRGPGETQLETDRRLLGLRIKQLNARLKKIKSRRNLAGSLRKKKGLPTIALVGYTNAGKSTLFNVLTQSDVEAKDLMFATLDPTIRAMEINTEKRVLLADTVGFIEDLPPTLIEAFAATLEETTKSQLILHVIDIGDSELYGRVNEVNKILKMIGADKVPTIMVYNKIDLLAREGIKINSQVLDKRSRVDVSARTGEGINTLKQAIAENLYGGKNRITVKLRPSGAKLRSIFYERGLVVDEKVGMNGDIILKLMVDQFESQLMLKYKNAYDLISTDSQPSCERSEIGSIG